MHVRQLFDLSRKVAIVTGGGSGLGRHMAQGLAEAGADLVLCARKVERCEQAAAELRDELGVRAIAIGVDVRDPNQIEDVVERTVDEFGSVDILVNNSGTSWGASPEDIPLHGWQKVIDVNLTGAFLFAQSTGRRMIKQGGGKIINVTSIAAFRGAPQEAMNALPYNTSKGGLVALTRDLAVKWARFGITINAIAPGWFPTEMSDDVLAASGELLMRGIPLRRWGGADDLKGAVVYLSSAASNFVTGTVLAVDGGQLAG